MGPDGSTCSECLPERTCYFKPPEHVPRTSAGAQTCVWGPGGLPVCHGAENTRNDPQPEEKQNAEKNTFTYVYILVNNPQFICFFLYYEWSVLETEIHACMTSFVQFSTSPST